MLKYGRSRGENKLVATLDLLNVDYSLLAHFLQGITIGITGIMSAPYHEAGKLRTSPSVSWQPFSRCSAQANVQLLTKNTAFAKLWKCSSYSKNVGTFYVCELVTY